MACAGDQGYLFHPDERQIVFVSDDLALGWPPDWRQLLSPASSWNPHFFSYGSLPLYLLRILANVAGHMSPRMQSLREYYVIGRVLSALADTGTVLMVYLLGRRLYGHRSAWLGAACVALAVLHVQLAHFYAVDTLLTFAAMFVLYLCLRIAERPTFGRCLGAGATIGVSCAIKVSALPLFLPLAGAWCGALWLDSRNANVLARTRPGWIAQAMRGLIAAGWAAAMTFLLLEPYALIDLGTFLNDLLTESMMARGTLDLPYTRQYAGTAPYWYPISQMVRWSLGWPLGIVSLAGTGYALWLLIGQARQRRWQELLLGSIPMAWFLVYLGLTGGLHAKFLRYMLPITPLLCLWGASLLVAASEQPRRFWRTLGRALTIVTLGGSGLYAIAYLHIYGSVHPWIQATEWICQNVPVGSTLMIEHWDQPLPILQGVGKHACWNNYRIVEFAAYDADTPQKLAWLINTLPSVDYVVISSNRLYGSIGRMPERYPITSQYYRRLFAEELGFQLVYFSQVYPQLGPVRLVHDTLSPAGLEEPVLLATRGHGQADLRLGLADESYSVYDHPMPLIFERVSDHSVAELARLLSVED